MDHVFRRPFDYRLRYDRPPAAAAGAIVRVAPAEVEQVSEGVLQRIATVIVEDETEQVSEGVLRALTLVREVGETENIVEATLRVMDLVRLLDEDENIAEGVLQRIATVVETGEVEQISEANLRVLGIVMEDGDTENIAEAVLQRIATVIFANEDENVTEGVLRALTLVRLAGEPEQVSEGAVRALILVRIVGETENIVEATLRVMAQVRVDGDVEQVAEQVNHALATVVEDGDVENIGEGVLKILVRPPIIGIANETEQISEGVFAIAESAHLRKVTRAYGTHAERTIEPGYNEIRSGQVSSNTPQTTTSATLVNVPGSDVTVVLLRDGHIHATFTFDAQTMGGGVNATGGFAVQIDGLDGQEHQRFFSGTNDLGIGAGVHRTSDSLPAGTYTVRARFRRVSGDKTVQINNFHVAAFGLVS